MLKYLSGGKKHHSAKMTITAGRMWFQRGTFQSYCRPPHLL